MGALNLIEGAIAAGCLNFVFSSTCATYGDQDGVLLDENSAQWPINSYGASKRAILKLNLSQLLTQNQMAKLVLINCFLSQEVIPIITKISHVI